MGKTWPPFYSGGTNRVKTKPPFFAKQTLFFKAQELQPFKKKRVKIKELYFSIPYNIQFKITRRKTLSPFVLPLHTPIAYFIHFKMKLFVNGKVLLVETYRKMKLS